MDIAKESVMYSKQQLDRTLGRLSFKRDPFAKRTRFKIETLFVIMEPADFFEYLLEQGFINKQKLNCKHCGAIMQFRKKQWS